MKNRVTRWLRKVHRRNLLFSVHGRATRREFLLFTAIALACLIIAILPGVDGFSLLVAVLSVLVFLAVSVRRLHDAGSSAWTLLTLAVPYIGFGWFLFSVFAGGQDHPNKYGSNPRYEPDAY